MARADTLPPRATYRVQLGPQFGFDALSNRVPYLRDLGISHLYLSPIFSAGTGSTHGYDVTDWNTINPELGGEEAFLRLSAVVRQCGLKILLDIVPNHMAIAGGKNPWWDDVLKQGRSSPYAGFFDLRWREPSGAAPEKIILPLLEDYYGKVLEQGKIALERTDPPSIRYGDLLLPLSAASLDELRGKGGLDRFSGTPGAPETFRPLHELLERQHYRLARWQTGAHEMSYRRFFAINSLVGLRMEKRAVFSAVHRRIEQLLRDGHIHGLRVDHIDGLRQPADYLESLTQLADGKVEYVVVEKILGDLERLPAEWPVDGTTGYEFCRQLNLLFTDAEAKHAFNRAYTRFTGEPHAYEDDLRQAKQQVLRELFAGAIDHLASDLSFRLAEDWRWQDLTRSEIAFALTEFLQAFPVYRTYRHTEGPAAPADRAIIAQTCATCMARHPLADPLPFEFLRDLLTGDYPEPDTSANFRRGLLEWVLTFQQYTGAVMAKAAEDTAFYVHVRLIALNEVGGDPGRFGGTRMEFHQTNHDRLAETPASLVATSTHDTKLSEDARARLAVLSEIPQEWETWLEDWRLQNRDDHRWMNGAPAPDPNDEYRLYQILLAIWPLAHEPDVESLRPRLHQHTRKAVEEAKRKISSLYPNSEYIEACLRFVDQRLDDIATASPFGNSFRRAVQRLALPGAVNSLTQLVLKATVPGVPDFYQGCESWDFSLVDPDNRRPVDWDRLQSLANSLRDRSPAQLLRDWRDGGIKLWTTRGLLALRAGQPLLFARGAYEPLFARGAHGERVLGFLRRHDGRTLIVLVPRFATRLGAPPVGAVWDDTQLILPHGRRPQAWRNVFTQRLHQAEEQTPMRDLFAELPFAVLVDF